MKFDKIKGVTQFYFTEEAVSEFLKYRKYRSITSLDLNILVFTNLEGKAEINVYNGDNTENLISAMEIENEI